MDENRLQYLHQKYISNQMSPEELDEWKAVLGTPEIDQPIQQLMDDHWLSLKAETRYLVSEERSGKMYNKIIGYKKYRKTLWSLWPRIAVAAAVTAVIFGSGILYYYNQDTITEQGTNYANDIAPGKNGATLTLANGQKILITEAMTGNIANQSGVRISKDKDGQISYEINDIGSGKLEYNTLSTTRGEQTRVRLPDGSLVFLNAASSLKYPTSFVKLRERRVELNGEGYFEVAKDKDHPFMVKSSGQEIEVLGTHFNINSYTDEASPKTTLIEGSVKISVISSERADEKSIKERFFPEKNGVMLKPGQQAVLSGDGKIVVANADTETTIAWKNNQFMFDGENIQTVMRMVARWYNVEVEYVGEVTTEKFLGGVSRFDHVSKVLKSLESTGKVHFRIEGKKIYVLK